MSNHDIIIDRLFLGNATSSCSGNYNLVVNCAEQLGRTFPYISEHYIHIPVLDDDSDVTNDQLYDALMNVTEKIHDIHQKQMGTVLVHCMAGISRSATVVTAYLLRYSDLSLIQSLILVKHRRPITFSYGVNFEKTLQRFAAHFGK